MNAGRLVLLSLLIGTGCGRGRGYVVEKDATFYNVVVAREGAQVTYMTGGSIFRIAARAGSTPENVSNRLAFLGSGEDRSVSVSKNGNWLILESTRPGQCHDWECLVLVKGDLKDGTVVNVDGEPVHARGRAAVSDDGAVIVYPSEEGPHEVDLVMIRRSEARWGDRRILSATSSEPYNVMPILKADGSKVLFDCGSDPYSQDGTHLCEVGIDGKKVVKKVDATTAVDGAAAKAVRRGDYAPDGTLVFEGEWTGEQLWLLRGTELSRLRKEDGNDNSPCVLPDGRVASLWLGRSGGPGLHELKLTAKDGAAAEVILPNVDVTDTGLSCHR